MIIEQQVEVKINSQTLNYYQSLGYNCKVNDIITIKNEELPKGSCYMEVRECECCHSKYVKRHCSHLNTFKSFGMDVCKNCIYTDKEVLQKWKQLTQVSCLKNSGYNNPFENPQIQQQIKQTNLNKYGCENPSQNPEVVKKREQTFLQRFGVKNPLQNKDVIEKLQQTNLKRYGVKNPNQNLEIKAKGLKTLSDNGNVKTSSQQKACKNLLEEQGYTVKLNSPVGTCFLDVEIILEEVKIDLEYDGTYWHQDKLRDRKRDEFIKSQGYKILRIESSKNKVPTFEQLKQEIDYLLESEEHKFAYLNLD